MAHPSDSALSSVGAPTVDQIRYLQTLQHQLMVDGIDPTDMYASYPEAAQFANPTGAKLLGMPIIAGPLGILVTGIR